MSDRQDKHSRLRCIRAYRLKQEGLSHSEIAKLVGKSREAIPVMVRVGERFADGPLVGSADSISLGTS